VTSLTPIDRSSEIILAFADPEISMDVILKSSIPFWRQMEKDQRGKAPSCGAFPLDRQLLGLDQFHYCAHNKQNTTQQADCASHRAVL
jgi:hypothetical protein